MDLVAALDAKRNEMEAKHARERERGCNHLGVLRLIARLSTEIVQNALDPIQKRRRRKRVREREREGENGKRREKSGKRAGLPTGQEREKQFAREHRSWPKRR